MSTGGFRPGEHFRPVHVDGCLKRPYTKRQAKRVLERAQNQAKTGKRRGGKLPVRYYGPCPEGNYHVTSSATWKDPAKAGQTPAQAQAQTSGQERAKQYAAIVRKRARGQCERCGAKGAKHPWCRRGGHGSASTGLARGLRPSNNAIFCDACSHSVLDTFAGRIEGWHLDKYEQPSECPVFYRGVWMLLDDEGGMKPSRPLRTERAEQARERLTALMEANPAYDPKTTAVVRPGPSGGRVEANEDLANEPE